MSRKAIITKEQAVKAVYDRVEARGHLMTIEAQVDIEISQLKEKYADKIDAYEKVLKESGELVQTYVEKNRKDLFPEDVKSIELGSAKVGFRLKPAKVTFLEGWDLSKVLKRLKAKHPDLVIEKTKQELDKRKVIEAANDKLKGKIDAYGIKIEQEEIFFIK